VIFYFVGAKKANQGPIGVGIGALLENHKELPEGLNKLVAGIKKTLNAAEPPELARYVDRCPARGKACGAPGRKAHGSLRLRSTSRPRERSGSPSRNRC
jgi:hypothetical protein